MSISNLLTTAQVAERYGASRRTITRWARDGRLPVAARLPGETGALLFDPVEVEQALAELRAEASA